MKLCAAFLTLCAIAPPAFAQSLEERRERYLNIDMELRLLDTPRRLSASDIRVPTIAAPVASVQVRLKLVDPGTRDWMVIVESFDGAHREAIPAADVQDVEHWSSPVPGGMAIVRLVPDATTANIQADAYAIPITIDSPQGLIGQDDSKFLDHMLIPPGVVTWTRAIARLSVMTPKGRGSCTGFLVGSDLMLTNQHCIANNSDARQSWVEFGVDSTAASPTSFRIIKLIASDPQLDYSLVRISGNASSTFGRLYLGAGIARNNTTNSQTIDLWIVQHPKGGLKKVAFPPNCSLRSPLLSGVDGVKSDFGTTCDTRTGSSGAPVMDVKTALVLGLHHWDVDPRITKPEEQENQAVHIDLISTHLRMLSKADPQAVPRSVLEQVFQVRP
jgi:hypothetical protein